MKIKDSNSFCEQFFAKFLENGFGALPKRELEIYLLHLLLEDGQFKNEKGLIDFHEMSLALKMTETKVRNLVYEIELKYQKPIDFSNALINLVEKQSYEVDLSRNAIKFAIQSPLLKQAFEYEVRKLGGVSDGSFAKHLITIKAETFAKLLNRLYGDQVDSKILDRIAVQLKENETPKAGLFRLFAEEFVKTSGGKTAEMIFDNLSPIAWLKALRVRSEVETSSE